MEFVAKSPISQKILNTLRVSANLPVNILIHGEPGTGKKTLVESVFKDIALVSVDEVKHQLKSKKDLYIYDLHRCDRIESLMANLQNSRIIATATEYKEIYEEYFPIILHIPPLKERPEDLAELKKRYIEQVERDFEITIEGEIPLDLSKNAISLKKSIYSYGILSTIDEMQLMKLMERLLQDRLEEGYKNLLYLFEVPLLRAAKKRYRSNLAISKALQLNRATVTTKMNRYKDLIE